MANDLEGKSMKKVLVPFLFGMAAMGFLWSLIAVAAVPAGEGVADPAGGRGNRFEIIEIPGVHATAWLLDTREGRVWRQHLYPELAGNNQVWIFRKRIDSREEFLDWYQNQDRSVPAEN